MDGFCLRKKLNHIQSRTCTHRGNAPWWYCLGVLSICHEKSEISFKKSSDTAHSSENFRKKMEFLRRIPLFPFQPKWPENPCTICQTTPAKKKEKKEHPSSRIRTSDLRIATRTLQSSALPTELSKDYIITYKIRNPMCRPRILFDAQRS